MKDRRPTERRRVPPPLLRKRIGSGRGAMEQPNATDDGAGALPPQFWAVLVLTGVASGLLGAVLMLLLFAVADLAYGPNAGRGNFQDAVTAASPLGRVVPLLVAGVIGGIGWFLLRRYVGGRSDVDDTIWTGDGRLGFWRSSGTRCCRRSSWAWVRRSAGRPHPSSWAESRGACSAGGRG